MPDSVRDRCAYPDCTRPVRPTPPTGRPTRYCEQADADGIIHNRASAFKARRAQRSAVETLEEEPSPAPVSMARAILDQRLSELPDRIAEMQRYFDGVLTAIRDAGDIDAAGAEVEEAHRDALTKVTEAEGRAAVAERTARQAIDRAAAAERDRDESDAVAEEALAEVERVRSETEATVSRVRAEAEAEIARLRDALAAAEDQLRQAVEETSAARLEVAAAHAAAQAEREALRSDHAAQIARMERANEERVQSLSEALAAAREAAAAYQAQAATLGAGTAAPPRKRTSPKKSGPQPDENQQ
ncbi:hypothetical protein [Mycolicibacterium goodii]|uniref:hypothetical protein n=1 Tax=Mycolicibacterium goodii TaxID=134601 RepID=UPI001BDD94BD|nr:hypothetical protein [Mycolicibacterium goodii]MBU8841232.1 hypothetical protein [Mycolicibacterium goodii]